MKRKIEFASHPANLCSVRSLVRRFAAEARVPEDQVELLVLGVDEACANVIRHAYKREPARVIGLSCEQSETGLRFRIRDYGGKCEPAKWCGRPLDSVQPGGLGLHLIRSAFDHVDYQQKRNGMELVLTKNFAPPPAKKR